MTPLWSSEALKSVFPNISPSWKDPVYGISIDTRTLKPGDLFFALQGDAGDGHRFLHEAFQKGAVAACIQQDACYEGLPDSRVIRVPHTLRALEQLAQAARRRLQDTIVIGVTGSAGKTSVKDGLKHIFKAQGLVHASLKSFNNHYGVPLTLAQCSQDARWAVFEIGMNHAGEIRPLTAMVQPHIAIITTIAPAHLAFFPSEAHIADAKAEIFEGMAPGGYAILPIDNPHFDRLQAAARRAQLKIVTFGQNVQADYRVVHTHSTTDGVEIEASFRGVQTEYRLPVPGMHRVLNSLALLGCVQIAGGDIHQACESLKTLLPSHGRGRPYDVSYRGRSLRVLDESYNANPASMSAALRTLASYAPLSPQGRRLALLGDMRELGECADEMHAQLATIIRDLPLDQVITCGDHMRHLHDALDPHQRGVHYASSEEVVPHLGQMFQEGDVVMMKGSLSMRMKLILDELLSHDAVR